MKTFFKQQLLGLGFSKKHIGSVADDGRSFMEEFEEHFINLGDEVRDFYERIMISGWVARKRIVENRQELFSITSYDLSNDIVEGYTPQVEATSNEYLEDVVAQSFETLLGASVRVKVIKSSKVCEDGIIEINDIPVFHFRHSDVSIAVGNYTDGVSPETQYIKLLKRLLLLNK